MSWEIIGYPTMASAPVQDGSLLAASTPNQAPTQGIQVNNAGTVSATVTVTLASGFAIPAICPVGSSMWPYQATNYTTGGSDITVYRLRTA
jgi:hypothetical protein